MPTTVWFGQHISESDQVTETSNPVQPVTNSRFGFFVLHLKPPVYPGYTCVVLSVCACVCVTCIQAASCKSQTPNYEEGRERTFFFFLHYIFTESQIRSEPEHIFQIFVGTQFDRLGTSLVSTCIGVADTAIKGMKEVPCCCLIDPHHH